MNENVKIGDIIQNTTLIYSPFSGLIEKGTCGLVVGYGSNHFSFLIKNNIEHWALSQVNKYFRKIC